MKNIFLGIAVVVGAAAIGIGGAYAVSKALPDRTSSAVLAENSLPPISLRHPRSGIFPGSLEFRQHGMDRMDRGRMPFHPMQHPQDPSGQGAAEEDPITPDPIQ